MHQFRSKLHTTKKRTKTISEYMLCVQSIADLLMALGDTISEHDQVDAILQGLLEEYNLFIMMVYGKTKAMDIYDVETLLIC